MRSSRLLRWSGPGLARAGVAALVLGMLAAALWFADASAPRAAQSAGTPTVAPLSYEEQLCLQRFGLWPHYQHGTAALRQGLRADVHNCAVGFYQPTPNPALIHRPPPSTPPTAPPGYVGPAQRLVGAGRLIESGEVAIPGGAFLAENQWVAHLNGHLLLAYAGKGGYDSEIRGQGVLLVFELDSADHLAAVAPGGSYPMPVKTGSVHITGAVGYRLTLQSTDGQTWVFDTVARQFVSGPGVVPATSTPAVTPAATATPAPR